MGLDPNILNDFFVASSGSVEQYDSIHSFRCASALTEFEFNADKLLSKLEESEPDPPTSQEDECVICINARATMQTSPCGHRVVCRRCFVKTIQSAVAQRLLPLRCVICRARVNRLTSSSGTWRIQESASSYSMGSKSWASASLGASSGSVPASASSYSMGDAHSAHGHGGYHSASSASRYPRSPNGRVAQSASLYSMSSGSSTLSSVSNATNFSKTSSVSSGLYSPSPSSPISPSASAASYASSTSSVLNNHLAPPGGSHSSSASLSPGSGGSLSPRDLHHHHHHHQQQHQHQHHQTHSHNAGCPSGCSGAVPRKPLQLLGSSSSSSTSSNGSCGGVGVNSGIAVFTPTTHTYPGRRHTKGRLVDLQNRLPPIKEFRSPAKVPHPSPVHISNPRFRYSSYTKSASNQQHEMLPLLCEPPSPPRRPLNIQVSSSLTTLGPPPHKPNSGSGGLSAKVSPLQAKNTIPKNAYTMPKDKKGNSNHNLNGKISNGNLYKTSNNNSNISFSNILTNNNKNSNNNNNNNNKKLLQDFSSITGATKGSSATAIKTNTTATATVTTATNSKMHHHRTSASSRSFPLFSSSSNNHKEKADNKKNESMERKKKEEKLKLKAEKEARKEEKRMAKEEERLAKLIAKEEKKKGKKEAKELLIANDGNNKK